MVELIKDFPFTLLLLLIGLVVGTLISSWRDIFENYNFSGIGVNPVGFFTDYFSNILVFLAKGIFFGLVLGLLFGLIGLVVDFSRK